VKKSISIWSIDDNMSVEESIEFVSKCGFDGIELSFDEGGEIGFDTPEENLIKIRECAERNNIAISNISTWLHWDYPHTDNDPDVRKKGLELAKKELETAKILGAGCVLMIPGYVNVDFFIPDRPTIPYDVAYERAVAAFMEIKKYAEDLEVPACVENANEWGKFLMSPLELRDFVDSIDSPYVRVLFDTGNCSISGYPEQWIDVLGSQIDCVHIKDYRRNPGGVHAFVDLLSGDLDFPAIIEALKAIGYAGFLVAEMLPQYKYFPDLLAINTSRAMDALLGRSV